MSPRHTVKKYIPIDAEGVQAVGKGSFVMYQAPFSVHFFMAWAGQYLNLPEYDATMTDVLVVVQGTVSNANISLPERMAYRSDRPLLLKADNDDTLVALVRLPKNSLDAEVDNLPQMFDTRGDVWFLKRIAPNSVCEIALGFHEAGYENKAHYQKTQTEAIFLLSGTSQYGRHLLSANDNACAAIISPPLVADDQKAWTDIIQFVVKTPRGGRSDKVLVGSDEDTALRKSGVEVVEDGYALVA